MFFLFVCFVFLQVISCVHLVKTIYSRVSTLQIQLVLCLQVAGKLKLAHRGKACLANSESLAGNVVHQLCFHSFFVRFLCLFFTFYGFVLHPLF